MACYAVTRRDSLDLAAPHEPLVMDDPFDPPPPPSSPKLIVDRAGVALDQPDVLLLEGPRFRRKSVKFQERAFGILNPPPEPAEVLGRREAQHLKAHFIRQRCSQVVRGAGACRHDERAACRQLTP